MPYTLPEVPGHVLHHFHREEGKGCNRGCRYVPTLWTRLLRRIGL